MAKKQAASDATTAEPRQPRTLIVRNPKVGTGELLGLSFVDGVCETTDAIKAHASQEFGCTVFDKETQRPAWEQSET